MIAAVALALVATAPAPWQASATPGVTARIAAGPTMRLDYDFGRVAGYAAARQARPLDFPDNFELHFRVRGGGGVNDLQLKLVDASGDNVWWHVRRNFRPRGEWQEIVVPRRAIDFAWGPGDRRLRRTASVEVVVVRGRDGGAGWVEVDGLTLHSLPAVAATLPPAVASNPAAIDRDMATAWPALPGTALTIDYGGHVEIGGVVLRWAAGRGVGRYTLAASDDGRTWQTLRVVTDGNGGDDPIALPETGLRHLRVAMPADAPPGALAEVETRSLAWAATPNAFVASLAALAPRGRFPRGFSGQQPYWTLVGSDGGKDSGLIDADGRIEVARGGFSIEPVVTVDGRRFDWASVTSTPSLETGYLPLPHVAWTAPGWRLDIAAFADASVTGGRLMARYRLTNTGAVSQRLRLALAVRPFQVNPPAQFLGQAGGVSPIGAIDWDGGALRVVTPPAIADDPEVVRFVRPLVAPDAVPMASFDAGSLETALDAGPGATQLRDPTGLGAAALVYDRTLAPGATADIPLVVPFAGNSATPTRAGFDAAHAATVARWQATLGAVTIEVPREKAPFVATLRTALAQILMSRDGPALRPGTRSYDRSWIRDGAMMADQLLRLGQAGVAGEFARWYAGFLFDDGAVPCCVDFRGADPVPEHDSEGEFLYLAMQLYRFTGDRAALVRRWPAMLGAVGTMDRLRRSQRTAANLTADRRMLYGLMPPSISHEGYSAKAQYSLWDDFWALRGYKDAVDAGRVIDAVETPAIERARDQFAGDVHAAIGAAARHWTIDFIPGAVSLGDFDATSTTIALEPGGEQYRLDPRLLAGTYDQYWRRFVARCDGLAPWSEFTPYEIRNVSAFVRLGQRDRANVLLDWFMAYRRPPAWNGWAEVVGRDLSEIRFIGDMPHAWIASDYIRVVLDLFAYERADDRAIVLGAGLTGAWLRRGGVRIAGLRTSVGSLDFAARDDGRRITVAISGSARPAGGFVIALPVGPAARLVAIRGGRAIVDRDIIRVTPSGGPIRLRLSR